MPMAVCGRCGKKFYGWALKFRVSFCDCGKKLIWEAKT